jgi:phage terminase large subunit
MPTYSQAKKVIWDGTTNDGNRIIEYIPEEFIAQKNQQEMKIRLKNGSLFQLVGSDNIDSLMGTNPHIVVFSEYSLQTPDAWDFIRPILKLNGGTAIFIYTPRGRNHAYDLYQMASVQHDWWAQTLKYTDTNLLTKEDVEKEVAEGMSEELAEQEYACSFDRGVDGAFYAKIITKMRNEDRIIPINYDPYKLVHSAWDLGWNDTTAIIFFQIDGDQIKVIDCEEHSNKTLNWYKNLLSDKGYKYGTHLFPHDVEHVDGLSTGLTRKEILEDMQIPVTVVPRSFIVDGIEAVKVLLSSRVIINSNKCTHLVKSLENYHREYDDKRKVYKDKPYHDQFSHMCFDGETLIKMESGSKKIAEINIGDYVLTPNGMKRVLNKFVNETNSLRNIKTQTRNVKCTNNHKIFTRKGLMRSDAIGYNDEIYTIEDVELCQKIGYRGTEKGLGFRDYFLSVMMNNFYISTGNDTIGMETIIEKDTRKIHHFQHFKERFGLTIMGKYLKDIIFTIKTITEKIMTFPILSPFWLQTIPNFICQPLTEKKNREKTSIKQWNMQKNGTRQMLVENGIENTQRNVILGKTSQSKKYAINANKVMMQKPTTKDSVQTHAKQETDTFQELTISQDSVPCAEMNSYVINTCLKERVVLNVNINLSTTQKVYDIEVEDDHCYFANGFLVSNCDSMRYLAEGLKLIDSGKKSSKSDIDAINAYWGR